MHKYLFLLAWMDGSPGADEETHVHDQADLLPQFLAGNEAIFALTIEVGSNIVQHARVATAIGQSEAWSENFTGEDTLSVCELLDETLVLGTHFLTTRTIVVR